MERLRGQHVDVLVEVDDGMPRIVYWGAPFHPDLAGDVNPSAVRQAIERPHVHATPDLIAPLSLVPEYAQGFTGRPGLNGHRRRGTAWAPHFTLHDLAVDSSTLRAVTRDDVAELELTVEIGLDHALVIVAELTNISTTDRYLLHDLSISLPLPDTATELLMFEGRWTREFHQVRRAWPGGTQLVENRRGRTSHEDPPLAFAGSEGFSEWSGQVWGAHLAWSGNHRLVADRLADGRRYLQLGELLHPGELVLPPGGSYRTPEVIAVHSDAGLTPASQQFHAHLRARPGHPTSPRPVLINTWEAVYFDHDPVRLRQLADRAAQVGVERFVLDDGWFGSRRNDTSALGDWVVSDDAHPDGLAPLIDHVRALGMDFGIWVEPEMVSPDSDLYRAHPDWALTTDGYDPVVHRSQLVLDLDRPDAFAHVLGQLDALLTDHDIAFVKWDMNRDHIAGSGADGAAGSHAQTMAAYRLLDEIRRRHPDVEFESCSSGGGRIDHEVLRRAERVWTSDCNDPLERQSIQRGVSLYIPPELMGAHVGPPRAHTTTRRHDLPFRFGTAMFGHLGVEWDITALDQAQLGKLAASIELHKQFRSVLHHGDTVRFDIAEPFVAHGVYSADRRRAIVACALLATAPTLTPPRLLLPGLPADAHYQVRHVPLPGERPGPADAAPAWMSGGVELSGSVLARVGLQIPALYPESLTVVELECTDDNGGDGSSSAA